MKKHHVHKLKKALLSSPPVTHIRSHVQENTIKITGIVLCFLGIVLLSLYFFTKTHEEFAANFADYTLRPLIGNQVTIFFESLFFSAEDHANLISYDVFHISPMSPLPAVTNKPSTKFIVVSELLAPPTQATTSSHRFALTPIPPLLQTPYPMEGHWIPLVSLNQTPLLAKTYYRPDPTRPYVVADIVKINMQKLHVGMVAGLSEPGGPIHPGIGKVPLTIQQANTLIAAFNGGFQRKDGFYGMIASNTIYLPLQRNLATLVISQNNSVKILNYTGQSLGSFLAVRQNGPMLIDNGNIVTSSTAWDMQTWGLTTTNTMYTWRSGLGVTKDGDLVFVSGPSLVPQTLAASLAAAGAVNAMQLDINPVWVRFVLFNSLGNGRYSYYSLENDMTNGGYAYLTGYQKDFFYLYL